MQLSFKGQSRGHRYLLVGQRGVLPEQLREVRDSGTGSRIDPLLLYRIQLAQREGGRGVVQTYTYTAYCLHPVVGSFDSV